jgi:hypothetical protein
MPTDAQKLICVSVCVRCGLEVRVNRESYEIFERMHYICFHFVFEHGGFDPDEECDAPDCTSSLFNSLPAHSKVVPRRDRRDPS